MFAGVVENKGTVLSVEPAGSSLKVVMDTPFSHLEVGEDISINGVRLKVAEFSRQGELGFFIDSETRENTCLGGVGVGYLLNLERASGSKKSPSDAIPQLQGRIAGRAQIVAITNDSNSHTITFEVAKSLAHYCIEGHLTGVHGIFLIPHAISDTPLGRRFQVTMTSPAWSQTNLTRLAVGCCVNVEVHNPEMPGANASEPQPRHLG